MKVIEHLKLRKRRRLKTEEKFDAFFAQKDIVGGFEYSYAEKYTIVREQVQLRKKLDGITKIGDVVLHNCSGSKYPDPLTNLREFFRLMCMREAAHGIPPPTTPELMERRSSKPGDDSLATVLLQRQHAAAQALTHAFYW